VVREIIFNYLAGASPFSSRLIAVANVPIKAALEAHRWSKNLQSNVYTFGDFNPVSTGIQSITQTTTQSLAPRLTTTVF